MLPWCPCNVVTSLLSPEPNVASTRTTLSSPPTANQLPSRLKARDVKGVGKYHRWRPPPAVVPVNKSIPSWPAEASHLPSGLYAIAETSASWVFAKIAFGFNSARFHVNTTFPVLAASFLSSAGFKATSVKPKTSPSCRSTRGGCSGCSASQIPTVESVPPADAIHRPFTLTSMAFKDMPWLPFRPRTVRGMLGSSSDQTYIRFWPVPAATSRLPLRLKANSSPKNGVVCVKTALACGRSTCQSRIQGNPPAASHFPFGLMATERAPCSCVGA